jgi:hypothetical protein
MEEETDSLLHLSINPTLKKLAKQSGLNLSKEFEEWVKIRLGNIEEDKPIVNTELEIAKHQSEIQKHQSEIQKLKSQAEFVKTEEMKAKEEVMVLDNMIDNELKTFKSKAITWEEIVNEKIHGIQFLFQRKFNKTLNPLQAKELLLNRLKERKMIDFNG